MLVIPREPRASFGPPMRGEVLGPPMWPEEIVAAQAVLSNPRIERRASGRVILDGVITCPDRVYHGESTKEAANQTERGERLQGLVADTVLTYGQPNKKVVALRRFQDAESMNQLAGLLGIDLSQSFRHVPCEAGGKIPTAHYVEHLSRSEAPRATELETDAGYLDDSFWITHDSRARGHVVAWWTIPPQGRTLILDLSARAGRYAKQTDLPFSIDDHMAEIADSIDTVTEEALILQDPDKLSVETLVLPLSKTLEIGAAPVTTTGFTDADYGWLRLRVLQKYPESVNKDGSDEQVRKLASPLDRLWAVRTRCLQQRRRIELQQLAEHMRPDFSKSPVRHLARKALWEWAKL